MMFLGLNRFLYMLGRLSYRPIPFPLLDPIGSRCRVMNIFPDKGEREWSRLGMRMGGSHWRCLVFGKGLLCRASAVRFHPNGGMSRPTMCFHTILWRRPETASLRTAEIAGYVHR